MDPAAWKYLFADWLIGMGWSVYSLQDELKQKQNDSACRHSITLKRNEMGQ